MACACIGIYRAEPLDEPIREILRSYQRYVIEDTCWFSIDFEWHMKPAYTDYEKQQLTEVFGRFPEQEILIFGECDRIFVAAYEIIKHFGGLLNVNISDTRKEIYSHRGIKIEIHKKKWRNQLRHEPDYWLVDHIFIREFFAKVSGDNFEKYKL
ncbi:MAG TPA: hypothetical protein VFC41_09640, partial [Anaerovoracaceae bacterium]|nr:hypothetical protein [Anaerovoracaceae bacterium]